MTDIQTVAQSLAPDAIISLFTIDATLIGGPVLNFVQGSEVSGKIEFGGVPYEPIDVDFDGLETSGTGALPTPKIKVANSDGFIQALLVTYGDIIGCTLYRKRTFARYLDGGSEPDADTFYGPDVFRFERRTSENRLTVEWELSAAIDQEGKQIPGRQVIRDTCLWRYRAYNQATGEFDYSMAQCPYTGTRYFDINDNEVTDPALDRPSRRLTCCEKRFNRSATDEPLGQPLPFGGFPGVARVRA